MAKHVDDFTGKIDTDKALEEFDQLQEELSKTPLTADEVDMAAMINGKGTPYNPDQEEIDKWENLFEYHPLQPGQEGRYGELRRRAIWYMHYILHHCPPSAERTLAIRSLKDACTHAIESIAVNEK